MSDGTPGVNGTPEKLPGTRDFELPFLEILASIDAEIAKNLCSESRRCHFWGPQI